MIDVYSKNIEVAANTAIPFNNVKLKKGCYEDLSGVASFPVNHCGVYQLFCFGSVSGIGDIIIQVTKNGIVQPETVLDITGTEGTNIPFSFSTLIQVSNNNGPKCCQSPDEIQIINAGVAATYNLVDAIILKVC